MLKRLRLKWRSVKFGAVKFLKLLKTLTLIQVENKKNLSLSKILMKKQKRLHQNQKIVGYMKVAARLTPDLLKRLLSKSRKMKLSLDIDEDLRFNYFHKTNLQYQ